MKRSVFNLLSSLVLALVVGAAVASAADEPSPFKFEVHGIVGASMYVQTTPNFLLNGQGPLLLLKQNNAMTTGFDVRQTRLNFSVTGPMVLNGATPKAVIEADFFGLNSPGGYGEVSVEQRLRLGYAELNWGDTWIRVGQDWELLWANSPTSLGHIAFPATWAAGLIGWREPGFGIFHQIDLGEKSNVEGAFQVIKSDWSNPYGFGASTNNDKDLDAGQLSGLPGVEARVKLTTEHSTSYVSGHWNRVASNQAAQTYVGSDSIAVNGPPLDVIAFKVGGKYSLANVTVQGELYFGKNTAPLFGEQSTFYSLNDIHEGGGWLQAGYNFTPELSLWGLYGTTRSDVNDVTAAGGGAFSNQVYGGMLMYKSGNFAFGPEVYQVVTQTTLGANAGTDAPDGVMDAMQYMASAMYTF